MATRIRPIADAAAGEASLIAVRAFNESEVLTALRDDSGDLLLIGWHTPPQDAAIDARRGQPPAGRHGSRGRTHAHGTTCDYGRAQWERQAAVDFVGCAAWTRLDHPPQGQRHRGARGEPDCDDRDQRDHVGHRASRRRRGSIADLMARRDGRHSVRGCTTVALRPARRAPITIAALDEANVVTAVRNDSGNLLLIGWHVSPDGQLQRWDGNAGEAGEVVALAILPMASGGPTTDVLTAVQDGSGNLLLIAWRAFARQRHDRPSRRQQQRSGHRHQSRADIDRHTSRDVDRARVDAPWRRQSRGHRFRAHRRCRRRHHHSHRRLLESTTIRMSPRPPWRDWSRGGSCRPVESTATSS